MVGSYECCIGSLDVLPSCLNLQNRSWYQHLEDGCGADHRGKALETMRVSIFVVVIASSKLGLGAVGLAVRD